MISDHLYQTKRTETREDKYGIATVSDTTWPYQFPAFRIQEMTECSTYDFQGVQHRIDSIKIC